MSGETDPYAGWTFLIDPETGSHYVRTPNGHERLYTEAHVAEATVTMFQEACDHPERVQEPSWDLWRRVVGEDRWAHAWSAFQAGRQIVGAA